jgi:hypothetical protein
VSEIAFRNRRAEPVTIIPERSRLMNAVIVYLKRAVWILPALCLFLGLTTAVSAQGDPRVGTWELDLAKSTFSPGPPPRRQTLWYKVEGQGLTALLQGVDAAGTPLNPDSGNLTIYLDGKDHPTPQPGYDSSAWTRLKGSNYVVNRKKAGKVVLTSTNIVSPDGKVMTITTTGVDADGRPVNNVSVYNRQ